MHTDPSTPLLQVRGISKRYGDRVVPQGDEKAVVGVARKLREHGARLLVAEHLAVVQIGLGVQGQHVWQVGFSSWADVGAHAASPEGACSACAAWRDWQ